MTDSDPCTPCNSNNKNYENVKELIVEAFETMLKEYTAQGSKWKCKAYNGALKSLKNVPEIRSLDDIKGLPGFGKSLTEHVKEILETHEMKAAKESDFAKHVQVLLTVHGIGIQAARKFVKSGIFTVDKLRGAYALGTVTLNDAQKLGLKYYDDMQLRIPRSEMLKHERLIKSIMLELTSTGTVEIVGSFRRNAPDSGDIDLLIIIYYLNNSWMHWKTTTIPPTTIAVATATTIPMRMFLENYPEEK